MKRKRRIALIQMARIHSQIPERGRLIVEIGDFVFELLVHSLVDRESSSKTYQQSRVLIKDTSGNSGMLLGKARGKREMAQKTEISTRS